MEAVMVKGRKNFTKDFKEQAVKMVLDRGIAKTEVGRKLGVHSTTIGLWVKAFQTDSDNCFPGNGKSTPAEEELRKLRAENKQLRLERDFLKKTAIWFAKENQ
jgi:transposase